MDHDSMFLVLVNLVEEGPRTSGEVADALKILNPKYVSVLFSRCHRRGFVSRESYRRGRERGYIYALSEKGVDWVRRKGFKRKTELSSEKTLKVVEKQVPVLIIRPTQPTLADSFQALVDFCFKIKYIQGIGRALRPKSVSINSLIVAKLDEEVSGLAFLLMNMLDKEGRREKLEEYLMEILIEEYRFNWTLVETIMRD